MSARRYTLIVLIFLLVLVFWMMAAAAVLTPYRTARINKAGASNTPASTQTATPFRPVADQPTAEIQAAASEQPPRTPQVLSLKPLPTRQPTPQPFVFQGIDFSNHDKRIRITIYPPDEQVNQGKPIVIVFYPGDRCAFGDQRACINSYQSREGGQVTFVTIHSGIGGQAENFRDAIEGSGLNQPGFSLKKTLSNLQALQGARVEVKQGETILGNLELAIITRIPASGVNKYIHSPADRALEIADDLGPDIPRLLHPEQPQLIFETCGWKMPEEPWAKSVSSTSGSIYLAVIQKTSP